MEEGGEERQGDASSTSSLEQEDFTLFAEPEGFRPPTPPPTKATYQIPMAPFPTICLSLVGSHPLWAHHLWNAAPTLSNYLCETGKVLCNGKNVLELGAAAGLPSIVADFLGAAHVVATDYPDQPLIDNLQRNIDDSSVAYNREQQTLSAEGYIWGQDASKLKAHLDKSRQYFDLLLMSDLIFNHQAHRAMIDTMDSCLPPSSPLSKEPDAEAFDGPQALVFFTHHRPHLADKDMCFFKEAENRGWTCRPVGNWRMSPMFPNDPGSEEVRGTVHGWQIYR